MLHKDTFIAFAFLKKENYHGSLNGMRYRLGKGGTDPEHPALVGCVWPEPYCFEKTEDDKKQWNQFPFSNEGREQAIEWFVQMYEEQKPLWELQNPYR